MKTNPELKSSAAFVEQSVREFDALAIAGADQDAEHCVNVNLGIPTPGQTGVLDAAVRAQGQLLAVQQDEIREAKTRCDAVRMKHDTAAKWTDLDHLPEFAPARSMLPVRLRQGGVAGVLGAETLLLIEPINESLRGGTGRTFAGIDATFTGVAGAVTITLLGAYMAHTRAEAIDSSESAANWDLREAADASANRATVGLLLATAAAIVTRIYAANLDQGGIDESGIAFFVLLQLVFLFVAFTLPQSITSTRRAINRLRLKGAADSAMVELEEQNRHVADLAEQHRCEPSVLDDGAETALNKHMVHLANNHPDSYMGDLVRTRLAEAHHAGTMRSLVSDRSPEAAGPTIGDDAPTDPAWDDIPPDAAGDGTPDDGDDDGPGGRLNGDELVQAPDGPRVGNDAFGPQKLLQDIFNRRAS